MQSTEDSWTTLGFDDFLKQGCLGADPAVVRGDFHRYALMRVQSPADEVDSGIRCHPCLEHVVTRLYISQTNSGHIGRRQTLSEPHIDGELSAVIQRENVST